MTSIVLIGAPTAALVFLLLNAAHAQAPLVLNTPQPTPTMMASGQLPDQLPEWSLYGENLEHRWSSTEHATVYSVEAHYGSDVELGGFVDQSGQAILHIRLSQDVALSPRWTLAPQLEGEWWRKAEAADGVGHGLATGLAAVRLLYRLGPHLAPYVGAQQSRSFGQTARQATQNGLPTREAHGLAGVRFWF